MDVHRNKIVLFGGYIRGRGNANDMWEWDGEKWDSIPQPDMKPSARSNMYMVYDIKRKKVVLYGGSVNENNKFKALDEVWEWDGKLWKKINYQKGPGENEMYGMIYHERLKKTIVYGGRSGNPLKTKDEMWTWDGKKWEMIKQASHTGNHTYKCHYFTSLYLIVFILFQRPIVFITNITSFVCSVLQDDCLFAILIISSYCQSIT